MMKMRRNTKGFTLIELLIVVAIIGILAAIAIPAYSGYTAKAKVAGVVHSMGAIKTAVSAYYTEAGAVVAAATETDIKTAYGIDVPTQYATFGVAGDGTITALTGANLGTDASNKTIVLKPDTTFKSWTWDPSSTIPVAFLSKG
jgi:type IV pilus assembly protein PilA